MASLTCVSQYREYEYKWNKRIQIWIHYKIYEYINESEIDMNRIRSRSWLHSHVCPSVCLEAPTCDWFPLTNVRMMIWMIHGWYMDDDMDDIWMIYGWCDVVLWQKKGFHLLGIVWAAHGLDAICQPGFIVIIIIITIAIIEIITIIIIVVIIGIWS